MDWVAFEREITMMCIGCFFGGVAIGILLTLGLMARAEKKDKNDKCKNL